MSTKDTFPEFVPCSCGKGNLELLVTVTDHAYVTSRDKEEVVSPCVACGSSDLAAAREEQRQQRRTRR